jgi:hypothetical protein
VNNTTTSTLLPKVETYERSDSQSSLSLFAINHDERRRATKNAVQTPCQPTPVIGEKKSNQILPRLGRSDSSFACTPGSSHIEGDLLCHFLHSITLELYGMREKLKGLLQVVILLSIAADLEVSCFTLKMGMFMRLFAVMQLSVSISWSPFRLISLIGIMIC